MKRLKNKQVDKQNLEANVETRILEEIKRKTTTRRDRTEDRFIYKLYPFLGIGIKSPLRNVSGRKGLISRFLRI